jgi:hypothetical protein
MSLLWGDTLPALRELASSPSLPPTRATEVLQKLLE